MRKDSIGTGLILLILANFSQPLFGQISLERIEPTNVDTLYRRDFYLAYHLNIDPGKKDSTLVLGIEEFKGIDTNVVRQRWLINGHPLDTGKDTLLNSNQQYLIEVEGLAEQTGIFSGHIGWQMGEDIGQSILRFHRMKKKSALELIAPETGSGNVIRFSLHDTLGLTVHKVYPLVTSLNYVSQDDKKIQAKYKGLIITDERDRSVIDSAVISAEAPLSFILRIKGLRKAGKYEGVLRIGGDRVRPINHQFTLLIKRSWLVAALWILAGVLLSAVIRIYFQKTRPKALQEIEVREQIKKLNTLTSRLGSLEEDEKEVLKNLEQDYGNHLRQIGSSEEEFNTVLNALNERLAILPTWINVKRRVNQLDPGLKKDLIQELEDIKSYLTGVASKKESDDYDRQLKAILSKVGERIKTEFLRKLEQFKNEVEEAKQRTSEDSILVKKYGEISEKLNHAGQKAEEEEIEEAKDVYNEGKIIFVNLAINKLISLFEKETPLGVESDEWQGLLNGIRNKLDEVKDLDPEVRFQEYEEVSKKCFEVILTGLKKHVGKLKEKVEESLPDEEEMLESLGNLEDDISNELNSIDLQETQVKIGEILKKINEIAKKAEPRETSRSMDAEEITNFDSILQNKETLKETISNFPESLALQPNLVPGENLKLLKAKKRLISRWDSQITLILSLIAVVLGLQLLWVDNIIWGSEKDFILALLWGLGLHQVGNTTFSLSTLEQRFKEANDDS